MGLVARLGYGAFFCLVLPTLLAYLARTADEWVRLPTPWAGDQSVLPGIALAAAGTTIMSPE